MKYFFILGSNPTLSLAELSAVFPDIPLIIPNENCCLMDSAEGLDAQSLIAKLGGIIKIGLILDELVNLDIKYILSTVTKQIDITKTEGKFKFGFSFYGRKNINYKIIALELKKWLKESGVNSRWVISREPTLSSVVVEQNKLTSRGMEIVLIKNNEKLLIGKTLAVQPFKQLSFRDYGRPARDDYSGMLPPKLAQIMINLALSHPSNSPLLIRRGQGEVILDPFCGSGTILTEAMLMGYTNLIGSDISAKAVEDTKKNIEWIKSQFSARGGSALGGQISPRPELGIKADFKFQIFNTEVTQIVKHLTPHTIDAIITEPYLGPPRGEFNINKTIGDLENLYSQSLAVFKKILSKNGKVVMIWPVFQIKRQQYFLNPVFAGFNIVNPLPESIVNHPIIKLTQRHTIIYGRPGQKVFREIVILQLSI